MSSVDDLQFPAHFVLGAATAAYQVEGATHEGGRGESIWDRFCAMPGKVRNGENGNVAADHYHRYREDVALMAELGLSAYRFSIAWPRILPEGRGRVNAAGLDFYDRLVDEPLLSGIVPYPTLYHWDLPQVLEQEGGWVEPRIVDAFCEYVDAVTRRLGDRVDTWTTINEPWCPAWLGYGLGKHAPGRTDKRLAVLAAHSLLMAHGRAVDVIRANVPKAKAGIVLNLYPILPASPSNADLKAAETLDAADNRWFLDPVFLGKYPDGPAELLNLLPEHAHDEISAAAVPIDFLGVNYYSRHVVAAEHTGRLGTVSISPPGARFTAMGDGWEIYPAGLTDTLIRVHREYGPPSIFVTENGAAFDDVISSHGSVRDTARLNYLRDHLRAARAAIDAGVPLHGYFVWSLLDNFEWHDGYHYRFGIVYVDYPTQIRIVKDSGMWYAGLIAKQRAATPPAEALALV